MRRTLLMVAVALAITVPARAQSATADVHGVVLDPAGRPLAGATVLVVETRTRATRELHTGADGQFSALGLPPGPYEVSAADGRYSTRRQEDLELRVGSTTSLTLALREAALPETITVNDRPSVLERSRSAAATVIDEALVATLPTPSRNVFELTLLSPFAVRASAGGPSLGGLPGTLTTLVVDGVTHSNTLLPFAPGFDTVAMAYPFSAAAIREFRINPGGARAGAAAIGGGSVEAITQSGSARLRGAVFERFRDRSLNSDSARDQALDRPPLPYRANEFGASAGGPLAANRRHLFFASYDGLRSSREQEIVPSTGQGGVLPASLERLASPWTEDIDQDALLVRTDHVLGAGNRATARYSRRRLDALRGDDPTFQSAFTAAATTGLDSSSLLLSLGSTARGGVFNDLRVLRSRERLTTAFAFDGPAADILLIGGQPIRVGGRSPQADVADRWQIADAVSWVRGVHAVKAGVDVRLDTARTRVVGDAGRYLFQSTQALSTGIPRASGERYTQTFVTPGAEGEVRPDTNLYALFVEDQWRLTPGLTMDGGLRWSTQRIGDNPAQDPDAQLLAAGFDTSHVDYAGAGMAPRLGIAWAPPNRRVVIRGRYGVTLGELPLMALSAAAVDNGVTTRTVTFRGSSSYAGPAYPARLDTVPASARSTIFVTDQQLHRPRLQQASGGFEWEWMPNVSIAVDVLHVRGDHLFRPAEINIGAASPITFTVADTGDTVTASRYAPGPFTRFDRVIAYQSLAESRYTGVTAQLHRRYFQGIHYNVAYTWAKASDTAPALDAVHPLTWDDRRIFPDQDVRSRVAADTDRRHRIAASGVYETNLMAERFDGLLKAMLTGWTVSAVFTFETAPPLTAYVAGDVNGDGNPLNDIAPGTVRSQFRGPKWMSIDGRAARDIRLSRTRRVTLIAEVFNVRNRITATLVDDTLYTLSGTTLVRNPNFGALVAQADPRVVQLGVQFGF